MSKSPSLRRIQADVRELALDPSDRYHAAPLEDDMFEWHFTIRGADDTDFQGGVYHGRILLPPEYPFKPPHIMFLTPSGRFETNTKICLSFSAFHPELWQPAWGIRLILEALIAFLPSPADGAIGALDWTSTERKRLAQKSKDYVCRCCGKAADLLPELKTTDDADDDEAKKKKPKSRFEKEIEQLRLAQAANESKNKKTTSSSGGEEETKEDEKDAKVEATSTTEPGEEEQTKTDEEKDTADAPELATEDTPAPTAPPVELDAVVPPADVAAAAPDVAAVAANPYEVDISWLTDPMLNLAVVLLSTICFLLGRKALELLDELQSLNARS